MNESINDHIDTIWPSLQLLPTLYFSQHLSFGLYTLSQSGSTYKVALEELPMDDLGDLLHSSSEVAIKKLYKWILSSETPLCCFEKRYNLARETFPRKSPCIVVAYKLEENLVHLLERLNFCSDDNEYFSL